MRFLSISELVKRQGLRLMLVHGAPSPWGQAVKTMMQYKGLEFVAAPQIPGADNSELVAWAGVNSGPLVAWNDGRPMNRWNDILFLLERLAPRKTLVPDAPAERVAMLGMSHELCGELGLGWNRRLSLFKPARSLSDLGNRDEASGRARTDWRAIEANSELFNEDARRYGPLSHRRSRSCLSPIGS